MGEETTTRIVGARQGQKKKKIREKSGKKVRTQNSFPGSSSFIVCYSADGKCILNEASRKQSSQVFFCKSKSRHEICHSNYEMKNARKCENKTYF